MAAKFPEIATRIRMRNTAQPFLPYDIKTADGDTVHVPHTDFALVSELGETVEIHEKDGHVRIVNVRLIVSIETTRSRKGLLGQGGGKR